MRLDLRVPYLLHKVMLTHPPKRRLFKGSDTPSNTPTPYDVGFLAVTLALAASSGWLPRTFVLVIWSLVLVFTIICWAQGSASTSVTPSSSAPPERTLFKASALDVGCLLAVTLFLAATLGLLPEIFVWMGLVALGMVQWGQWKRRQHGKAA